MAPKVIFFLLSSLAFFGCAAPELMIHFSDRVDSKKSRMEYRLEMVGSPERENPEICIKIHCREIVQTRITELYKSELYGKIVEGGVKFRDSVGGWENIESGSILTVELNEKKLAVREQDIGKYCINLLNFLGSSESLRESYLITFMMNSQFIDTLTLRSTLWLYGLAVLSDNSLLLESPDSNSQSIYRTKKGTRFLILGETGEFVKITDNRNVAFIHKALVQIEYSRNLPADKFLSLDSAPFNIVPVILSPLHNSGDLPLAVDCRWSVISGIDSFIVQIARDSRFETIINEYTVNTEKILLKNLEYRTRYFLRVRTLVNGANGDWSSVTSFTTIAAPVARYKIQSVIGTNPVVVTINFGAKQGAVKQKNTSLFGEINGKKELIAAGFISAVFDKSCQITINASDVKKRLIPGSFITLE